MYLRKTEKAITALATRDRALNLKDRAVLLLADGKKSDIELLTMVQAEAETLAQLTDQGFLERTPACQPLKVPSPEPAPRLPVTVPTSTLGDSTATDSRLQGAADPFNGRRSLATTRMFLFDLTERMFSRRDPELVTQMRERFRQARDRNSMLSVARDLLLHIEAQAGASRADEIGARLAMLLPDEIPA